MENCTDLFVLSSIACKISECLTDDELAILSINLTTLADMLQATLTKRAICEAANKEKSSQ